MMVTRGEPGVPPGTLGSRATFARCLAQSPHCLLDRAVRLHHGVDLGRLENQAHLFTRARDPQIAAALTYALQAADQRTEAGAIHESHQMEVYDYSDLAVGYQLGDPFAHRRRRTHIEAAMWLQHHDAIGRDCLINLHSLHLSSAASEGASGWHALPLRPGNRMQRPGPRSSEPGRKTPSRHLSG